MDETPQTHGKHNPVAHRPNTVCALIPRGSNVTQLQPPPPAPTELAVRVGRNIALARMRAGLTQRMLAIAIGLNENDGPEIARLEDGRARCDVDLLNDIADAVGEPVAALFANALVRGDRERLTQIYDEIAGEGRTALLSFGEALRGLARAMKAARP